MRARPRTRGAELPWGVVDDGGRGLDRAPDPGQVRALHHDVGPVDRRDVQSRSALGVKMAGSGPWARCKHLQSTPVVSSSVMLTSIYHRRGGGLGAFDF